MDAHESGERGVAVAAALFAAWLVCLIALLRLRLPRDLRVLAVPLALVMAFLYSGLFITAHDAAHGSVHPRDRRLNDAIGRVGAAAFALFSFDRLRASHAQHHRAPASDADPDYHPPGDPGFVAWYLTFLRRYLRPSQLAGLAASFALLRHVAGVPRFNALAFWVAPPLISSLQLFLFGTYLPHRRPSGGYRDEHRAASDDLPRIPSLLACYHFGYHHEHHVDPSAPWWRLPALRRQARNAITGPSRSRA